MNRGATSPIRGRAGVEARKRRLAADGWVCRLCRAQGRLVEAVEVDHITPLAHGGLDVDDNCRALCSNHHRGVTAKAFGKRVKPRIGPDGWAV